MSTEVQQATAQAVQAARQSEQYALVLAAVQAVQAQQSPVFQPNAPQQSAPMCQHNHPQPAPVGKWLAIGAAGTALGIAVALSALAVAASAVALTICLLVLRAMWQDTQRKD
jgi:hypothetical protein